MTDEVILPPLPGAPTDLWGRLAEVDGELIAKYVELAELENTERRHKLETYFSTGDSRVSHADREADFSALPLTEDIYTLRAEIKGLETERYHLRFYIEHRE